MTGNSILRRRLERLEQAVPKRAQLVLRSFSPEETEELHRKHAESRDPRDLLWGHTALQPCAARDF